MAPEEPTLPTKQENPAGLHLRYQVMTLEGVHAEGIYFVLRLDNGCDDKARLDACREAAFAYSDAVRYDITTKSSHLLPIAEDLLRLLLRLRAG